MMQKMNYTGLTEEGLRKCSRKTFSYYFPFRREAPYQMLSPMTLKFHRLTSNV